MKTDGIVKLKELDDFHASEKKRAEARKELMMLEEDKKALELRIKETRDIAYPEKQYKYSEAVLRKHKFWSDENFTYIAKIDRIVVGGYVCYTVCEKGSKDKKHSSSSLGILWRHPIPITEEKYNELRDSM